MPHELDRSNFRQMILESPDQFRVGMDLAKDIRVEGNFKAVEISGMGGSALPGNLLRIYLNDLFSRSNGKQPLAIYQNRFYYLPPEAHKDCLNLLCSYSGNTEETISAFQEALDKGVPCVGISAGGKIEDMCNEHGVPHVKLPIPFENFQPRVGTGYFFGAIFQILVNAGLVDDATEEILRSAEAMKAQMNVWEEQGKQLAQRLAKKTPIVYTGTKYKAVAMVWKIKLNENAKTPAFWNFFPELNHNELVGFTLPQAKFVAIMLRDLEDHPQNLKRFEVTAKLLREKGVDVEMVDMVGESVFRKTFSSIYLGDWTSYYLALEYGQDPTPVDMVESLKKLLV